MGLDFIMRSRRTFPIQLLIIFTIATLTNGQKGCQDSKDCHNNTENKSWLRSRRSPEEFGEDSSHSVELSSSDSKLFADEDDTNMNRNMLGDFYMKPCGRDRHCFNILSVSLECKNNKCQCRVWKGIQLVWTESKNRNLCLGAAGHPCVTNKMCHSSNCIEGICASAGISTKRIVHNKIFLVFYEIIVNVGIMVLARFISMAG